MRGVPSPVSCDLSPGDRHTWREATGPASSRSARPTVRYGGVRAAAGCGASARRAAARDDALSRKRKRARLPCHLRRESPSPLAATARHCPVRSRSPCSSRASFASLGLGRSAWRAEGAPLMTVKKILTATPLRAADCSYGQWSRLIRPVEPGPDRAACVIAVDSPLVCNSADEVQAVVPGRVDHSLVPRAAVVLDLDPDEVVGADCGSDGEGAVREAGTAVLGGIGREFGDAENHVIDLRAVSEECTQVGADCADVFGAARIGDVGDALREGSGCWVVHGSSLRRLVHGLCSFERTLSYDAVQ